MTQVHNSKEIFSTKTGNENDIRFIYIIFLMQ